MGQSSQREKGDETVRKLLKIWALVTVVIWIVSVSGCAGGGANVQTQTYTKTLGQELMDLHDSYTKGIITEKQYKETKEKLLEQRTR